MLTETQRRRMYEQLSPEERRAVDLGIYSLEDYYDLSSLPTAENTVVYDDWSSRPPAQAPAPEEEMGLLDTILGVPGAISAGRRAANVEAASMQRALAGTDSDMVMTGDISNPLSRGVTALGALYDAATTDATFGQAMGDRLFTTRDELAQARAEQEAAQKEVADIAKRSTELRTVADAAGSAPESLGSVVGGMAGGALGTLAGPKGMVAGAVGGSAVGSIPMVRKAFLSSWDEAYRAGIESGLSEEEAAALAEEQAYEQAAVEFGVEAVTGAIGPAKFGKSLLTRALSNTTQRAAIEAGSEAVTPYAQNAMRTASLALEGDEDKRQAIGSLINEWDSPELREEAVRGFLAGGLSSAALITPLSAVEARAELNQEQEAQARVEKRRAMVDEAKTLIQQDKLRQQQELEEFAQRNASVAQAFQQGVLKQGDLFDNLLNEDLAPSVGGAREIEQAQQLEQEAADQVQARRVRTTVDEVDRAITQEAIERPDNIMAQALFAANRSGDIANAIRPADTTTTEVAPQPEPEQLGLGFADPEAERIDKLRKQAQAQQRREAAKPTPLQQADVSRDKDRANFQKNYLTVNPNATTEEVLQRTQEWSSARDRLDSLRKSDTTLQAAEAQVAEQLAKMDENKRKSLQRKEKNAFDQTVREMAGRGIRDVNQIAQAAQAAINQVREANGLTTKAPQPTTAPATVTPVTQPNLTPVSQPTQQAPVPLLDEDNQPLAMSYEEVLKRLEDQPKVAEKVAPVVPEKSAVAEDSGEFDINRIEEEDIREQARANPNLREFLKGTSVRPILYHVQDAGVDIRTWRAKEQQVGPHLSADPRVGMKASRGGAAGKKVIRMAVNIKNPVMLSDLGSWGVNQVGSQLLDMGKITRRQFQQAEREVQRIQDEIGNLDYSYDDSGQINQATMDRLSELYDQENEITRNLIKAAGHDGVLYVNRFEIPGVDDTEKMRRVKKAGKHDQAMTDEEFVQHFPEADVSVMALDSNQVKNVDENTGEFNPANPDVKRALPDSQAAKAGKTTIGEINETYGEDVANLVEDYRNAKGPKQRVQALFDFLELTATGRDNAIVRQLLPLMRQFQNYIPDVVIETDKRLVKTSSGVDSYGYYNPNNGKLRLGMDGLNPRVVAHEILHALTWARIRDKAAVKADKNLAAAVAQLDDIRSTFQQWVDKNKGKHSGRLADLLRPRKGGLVDADGKVDVDELITYGLTDVDIQNVLRGLPARGTLKSQWRKFVNAVRLAVGLGDSTRNLDALDSLLDATVVVIGTSTEDNRAGVLAKYNDTIVDDVAKQARKAAKAATADSGLTREAQALDEYVLNNSGIIKDKVDEYYDLVSEARDFYAEARNAKDSGDSRVRSARTIASALERQANDLWRELSTTYRVQVTNPVSGFTRAMPKGSSSWQALPPITQAERDIAASDTRAKATATRDRDRQYGLGVYSQEQALGRQLLGGIAPEQSATSAPSKTYYFIHGGSNFDTARPSFVGRGESGNIRPLGRDRLYGFLVEGAENAAEAARMAYSYTAYSPDPSSAIHVFKLDIAPSEIYVRNNPQTGIASTIKSSGPADSQEAATLVVEQLAGVGSDLVEAAIKASDLGRLKRVGKAVITEDILASDVTMSREDAAAQIASIVQNDTSGRTAPELAATPETTAPVEDLSARSIAEDLSVNITAQRRAEATARGERTSVASKLLDVFLPEGSKFEGVRQQLDALRAKITGMDYDVYNQSLQEKVIAKYEDEAATLIRPGITPKEYAEAEAKIKQSNPELFAAVTSLREQARRNALMIVKELYESAPLKDGKPNPDPRLAREINAILANLDNYWTTTYQVHNKAEREQWQQIVRNTPDGEKIVKAASEFLENDLTNFLVADLPNMRRDRLERIHAAWVGSANIASMDKEALVSGITGVINQITDSGKEWDKYQKEAKSRVTSAVAELLGEKEGNFGNYYAKNRVGRGALKERLNVPEPIAKLMGRIEEPLTVLFNTEVTQRTLLNQLQTMRAIKEQYLGKFVFESRTEAEAMLGPTANIQQLSGPSMGALTGAWVPKELGDMFAIEQAPKPGGLAEWADRLNLLRIFGSAFKFSNLVLNPGLYVANLLASPVMAGANGVSPRYFTQWLRDINSATVGLRDALATGKFDQGARDILANGLGDHPVANMMRTKPLEISMDVLRKAGALPPKGRFEEMRDALSKTYSDAWTIYSGMDVAAKLTTFYHQVDLLERLNTALPEELRLTEEQINERAAARTKASTFSYELASEIFRVGDRHGVTMFLTYASETFRSLIMSVNRAHSDFQLAQKLSDAGHKDAASILRTHVSARLAGTLAASTSFLTIGWATGQLMMTLATSLGYGLSDEEEEEREALEQAYKQANPFEIHKNVKVVGKDAEGNYLVVDVGRFTDPYGPMTELVAATFSGDVERMGTAASSLLSLNPLIDNVFREVFSSTPAPKAVRDDPAAANAWNSQGLNDFNFAANIMSQLTPSWARTGLVDLSQATGLLADEPMLAAQEKVDEPLLATGLFNYFLRMRRYDPLQGVERVDQTDLNKAKEEANKSIRGTVRANPAVLTTKFYELRSIEADYLDAIVQNVNAAKLAGRSDEDILPILKKAGLTRGQMMYVLNPKAENYVSSVLSESTIKQLESDDMALAEDRQTRRAVMTKYDEIRKLLRELEKETQ